MTLALSSTQKQRNIIGEWLMVDIKTMDGHKDKNIQSNVERLLRDNSSTAYAKEEIINLLSSQGIGTELELETILGEIEVWSSMKDSRSAICSSCKGGTVYFQWEHVP
jgi:hypothetical protein